MSTLTDQDAFLHAICTDPDDDTARLVYADWLDEHGEHDRAEFIRVGCRIAGVQRDCWCGGCVKQRGGGQHHNGPCAVDRRQDDGVNLRQRHQLLLNAHERDWRGGGKCWRCGEQRFPGYMGSCSLADAFATEMAERRCYICHGTGFACWPLVGCETCRGSGELSRRQLVNANREPVGHFINDCGVCDGTGYSIACTWTRGFVSGIECPLEVLTPEIAKAIWRVHPVTSVRVSDREPDEPFWWWWRDGDGTYRSNRAYLPNYVFNKIDRPHILSLNGVHCESETEAMKLASNAWVAWGREQAGLPQLEMKC